MVLEFEFNQCLNLIDHILSLDESSQQENNNVLVSCMVFRKDQLDKIKRLTFIWKKKSNELNLVFTA